MQIDKPSKLYKYREFSDHTLESLYEGVIWVSRPTGFNDPYEYSFYVEPDMSYDDVKIRNREATRSNYQELQRELIEKIKTQFEIGGIFSLSKRRDVSLMWAHYADSHKGLCIGYGVSPGNDLGKLCHPVSYGDYPCFTLTQLWEAIQHRDDTGWKIFETMVLSKDKNWKYESEWRLLYDQKDMLVRPDFEITSITFGMRMPNWQKKVVKRIVDSEDVDYFETVKSDNSYDVSIKKCVP